MNTNILFYSRECHTCVALINILESENLLQYFIMMCVDDNLNKLPAQIEHVPTMIVKDQNKKLEAEETFEWIKKVKFLRQNAKNAQNQFANKGKVLSSMQQKSKINGFSDVEMGTNSDAFAFTKSDAPALPQSFFGYKDEGNNTIFTAPDKAQKLGEEEQRRTISILEEKRNEQDSEYKTKAKKEQFNAIINMEQQRLIESYKTNMTDNNTQLQQSQNIQQQQFEKVQQMQTMQNKLQQIQKMKHMMGGNNNNQ